jgi:cell division protein FtsB
MPRRPRSDARLDRSWPSDARRAEHPGTRPVSDPEQERKRRLRLAAFGLFLSLVFVGSSLAAVFGESGLLDLRRRHREIEALTKEVERRRAALAAMESHLQRLQDDPTAIERIAREDLGLVKPGEITFLLPREEVGTPGARPDAPPPRESEHPAPGPELP